MVEFLASEPDLTLSDELRDKLFDTLKTAFNKESLTIKSIPLWKSTDLLI